MKFEEFSQHFLIFFPIRPIAHGQIDERLFIDDTLFVRKAIEALFPVIAAHAAHTYSAERHLAGSEVNNRIVDAASAETTFAKYLFHGVLV